jgi:HK97 family phage major capsid protein
MFENIVNMWARMYGPCRPRAVWLVNQDIEPQLFTMSFEGTSSSVPAYLPAGGLSASPYGLLMGRPVIPTQACETLGDKGDIFLADFSQYLSAIKTGGVRAEVSIHLWFDYDVTAYRFIMRVAGQPWWAAAIDPRDGSNTLSPFVTLDERA